MGGRFSVVTEPDIVLDDDDVAAYSLRNFYAAHIKEFTSSILSAHEKHLFIKRFSKDMAETTTTKDSGPEELRS